MVKKSLLVSILALLVISMFGVNSACAGWHEWSQNARNEAILNEAYRDINKKFPELNCKKWVQQRVVKNASNGEAVVPATTDTFPYYYWKPSKDVLGRSGRIEDAKPGEIVQMYVSTTKYKGPHTAIVYAISSSKVTFIECNWCWPPCYDVKIRDVSFADFYKQAPYFTIYTIL